MIFILTSGRQVLCLSSYLQSSFVGMNISHIFIVVARLVI
jgi:hypothetical protein